LAFNVSRTFRKNLRTMTKNPKLPLLMAPCCFHLPALAADSGCQLTPVARKAGNKAGNIPAGTALGCAPPLQERDARLNFRR
jgi:hypothetical protein